MSNHNVSSASKTLTLGLILNSGFTIFELIIGSITGSLALIADGTHNLTDSLTLGIAYIAERIGQRSADSQRSYGYGRVRIIASLLNAGILVAVALFIGYEAIQRLGEPTEVPGLVVAAVATVGILINGSIAYLTSKHRNNLNAKAAYTNMLYDTLSSVGALLAGLFIAFFNWMWLDSAVGIIISVMLLWATFDILKDALHILLEGVPKDIDLNAVIKDLQKLEGVEDVDDVHAWMIDSDYCAFSCHLVIKQQHLPTSRHTVESAKELLEKRYKFKHSTIEIELVTGRPTKGHELHA